MRRLTPKRIILIGVVVILSIIGFIFWIRSMSSSPPTGTPLAAWQNDAGTTPIAPAKATPETGTTAADLMPTPTTNRAGAIRTKAPAAPALDFTYTLEAKLPEPTPTVPLTVYKEVTWEWAKDLAMAYGLSDQDPIVSGSSYIFEKTSGGPKEKTTLSLAVDIASGFCDFSATYPKHTSTTVRTNAQAGEVARAFLTKTRQLAPDLNPPKFYRLASDPTTIYVEYQRAWKPLPILEAFGMLRADFPAGGNLAINTADLYRDPTILQTSDGTDGFGRLNDFNTTTVGVDSGGRVIAVVVNTRPIDRILPDRVLKTPQQAWEDLTGGKGVLGYTLPDRNTTAAAWESMFPGGVASSDAAAVKTALLAYVEKGNGVTQRYLQPVYLFKGRAKLTTGPTSSFIVAVPALADERLPQ